MEAWETSEEGAPAGSLRPMSTREQWLAVFTAFGVKPLYMVLCLALIIFLWRQRAADMAALRWGLIWFWLGENACTINWWLYSERSHGWEYLHSYGMIVGFAFVAWALLEGLDVRLIKVSPEHERCAALSLCRACIKNSAVACNLQRLFKLLIPAAMILALMPLCWNLKVVSYNSRILGTLYHYAHYVVDQIYENRFCAVLALVLLAASWLVLMFKKKEPVRLSKALFAAALGPLSFGLMRTFIFGAYADRLVWFVAWEEITELIFVATIAFVIWIFRHALIHGDPIPET
jgi:hypothetical protein